MLMNQLARSSWAELKLLYFENMQLLEVWNIAEKYEICHANNDSRTCYKKRDNTLRVDDAGDKNIYLLNRFPVSPVTPAPSNMRMRFDCAGVTRSRGPAFAISINQKLNFF